MKSHFPEPPQSQTSASCPPHPHAYIESYLNRSNHIDMLSSYLFLLAMKIDIFIGCIYSCDVDCVTLSQRQSRCECVCLEYVVVVVFFSVILPFVSSGGKVLFYLFAVFFLFSYLCMYTIFNRCWHSNRVFTWIFMQCRSICWKICKSICVSRTPRLPMIKTHTRGAYFIISYQLLFWMYFFFCCEYFVYRITNDDDMRQISFLRSK